jgi:hypothetical protein
VGAHRSAPASPLFSTAHTRASRERRGGPFRPPATYQSGRDPPPTSSSRGTIPSQPHSLHAAQSHRYKRAASSPPRPFYPPSPILSFTDRASTTPLSPSSSCPRQATEALSPSSSSLSTSSHPYVDPSSCRNPSLLPPPTTGAQPPS